MSATTADVVVIGAGAVGAATALEICSRGRSVVILEAVGVGACASGNNAGLLVPEVRPDAPAVVAQFWQRSVDLFPSLLQRLREATGTYLTMERTGRLCLWLSGDSASMHAHAAMQAASGIAVEMVDSEEIRRREPTLCCPGEVGGLFFPDHAVIDPLALTQLMTQAAGGSGAGVRLGVQATRVMTRGGRVVGVDTTEGEIAAAAVIVAAGATSDRIGGLIPAIPMRAVKGEAVVCRPTHPLIRTVVAAPPRVGSVVPLSGGDVLIASTYEDAGLDTRSTAGAWHQLLHGALALLPGLAEAQISHGLVGLRPFTPDGLPLIGGTDIEGVYYATGHGRMGIVSAPLTGRLLGQLLWGEQTEVSLNSFSPRRFASKRVLDR